MVWGNAWVLSGVPCCKQDFTARIAYSMVDGDRWGVVCHAVGDLRRERRISFPIKMRFRSLMW